jgi:hypothetical protein
MKFSKAFKTFAISLLALVLVLGNMSFVQAVTFDDTQSTDGEMSASKLVSLGIMKNPGESFDPEGELTRGELALMVSKTHNLSSGKKALAIKDVTSKNSLYAPALKMVANGYLKLDSKGNFNANQAVTYAEFSKVLAQSLGLKASWTNRPVDFLFYLDRKGVLDIDTDLDATVTRVDAAVTYDAFLAVKGHYNTVSGLITSVNEAAKRIAIKTDGGSAVVTFNEWASVYVDGQYQDISSLFVGFPVTVTYDGSKKGAFINANQTSTEEGVLGFQEGTLKIGDSVVKNLNLNSIIRALPNNPTEPFSLLLLKQYVDAGVILSGAVDFTEDDEVTLISAQINKVKGKVTAVTADSVTVLFGKFTATFAVDANTVVENGVIADVVADKEVTVISTNGTNAATITLPVPVTDKK